MRATILVCAIAAAGAWCAFAEEVNVIYQHNTNLIYGTHYTIAGPPDNVVTIILGVEGQTFEFEAALEDNGQYVGPGDVARIIALDNAGPVTITVVGQSGHDFGARDIGEIDLDNTGVTGTVGELTIAGDYGAVGPMRVPSSGPLTIAGLVRKAINISDINGPVTIGQLGADLRCNTMQGSLTVTGPGILGILGTATYSRIKMGACP